MGESENVEKKVYDIIASSGSCVSGLLLLKNLPNSTFFNSLFTNGVSVTNDISGLHIVNWISDCIQALVNEHSRPIVYYLLKTKYCYYSQVKKDFKFNYRTAENQLMQLERKGIIEKKDFRELPEIGIYKKLFDLSEWHLTRTTFYTLTDPARKFYEKIGEAWPQIISQSVMDIVESRKAEIAKVKEQLKKSGKDTESLIKEVITAFIARENNQGIHPEKREYWMQHYCKNHGLSYEIYRDKIWKEYEKARGESP
ncbi:MAG: hypothetical protein DRN17_07795 [Thermoplasmata archaeon]|nr:MAG: hypothetical protein DRN17_07795 [Thermoplasmata archaeon]